MIKRCKKGQGVFGISFGVIFSIIVIIFTVSISFYAITYFLNLSRCGEIGFFYEDLQDEIDRAWTSGVYTQQFEGKLPTGRSGIKQVCFGELENEPTSEEFKILYEKFKDMDPPEGRNIFLDPPENACGGDLASNKLKHVEIIDTVSGGPDFYCRDVGKSGRVQQIITFDDRENNLVQISKS